MLFQVVKKRCMIRLEALDEPHIEVHFAENGQDLKVSVRRRVIHRCACFSPAGSESVPHRAFFSSSLSECP